MAEMNRTVEKNLLAIIDGLTMSAGCCTSVPVSIILGEASFVEDLEDPEADWGCGAPRYLTPEHVSQAAVAMADLTEGGLIAGVDQSEVEAAENYPSI